MDMTARAISRILKVNHAGEFGAIRIYRAQLWVARLWHPDLVAFLCKTLDHELDHCRKFREAMPHRGTRPCAAMPAWGLGGYALGFVTAMMGANAVLVCTKAVEQTVHRHLEEQIHYLSGRDEPLRDMILAIQVEENAHLHHAVTNLQPSPFNTPLEAVIVAATEVVIRLSTQGAVSRMENDLRRTR
ncbi:ubiquinone biosynthesis protein COQ7 [Asticcacaulis biprosthecium C19]|uniref:Ubiquinone biosynthesis protein COQ7 n=1 Tax=Asticcacaulis biprosthecium C19 TaxID=715226 RepID=F4QLL9_9CAUL|nr:demethoxyubiquinone hydroxylase family protein [Asticcacaulis biprosthecium]EGF93517.1 ubiquinone biosynthesis protein COQ7 [Asticcacaulis biprosthecium C19]